MDPGIFFGEISSEKRHKNAMVSGPTILTTTLLKTLECKFDIVDSSSLVVDLRCAKDWFSFLQLRTTKDVLVIQLTLVQLDSHKDSYHVRGGFWSNLSPEILWIFRRKLHERWWRTSWTRRCLGRSHLPTSMTHTCSDSCVFSFTNLLYFIKLSL